MNNQNMEMAWMLIASNDVPEVEKKLKKLEKKAEAYDIPFVWEISNPRPYQSETFGMIEVQDLSVSQSVIKSPNWEILANIQQEVNGNVVTKICANEINPEWHNLECVCEHCNTRRNRKSTYLVKNTKSGEIRQVGKTCLQEYTGIYPYFTLGWADLLKYEEKLKNGINPSNPQFVGEPVERLCDVKKILGLAWDSIEKSGYVSTNQNGSTAYHVRFVMGTEEPTEEGNAVAENIIKWISAEDTTGNDFLTNAKILATSEYIKHKDIGRVCYLPVSYKKAMERAEREAKRKAEAEAHKDGMFVGEVGKRLDFVVDKVEVVTTCEGYYGTSTLYKMIDTLGNVLTTWSSADPFDRYAHNLSMDHLKYPLNVKGTIKEHKEYNGEKQTVLSRIKVF